MKRIVLVGCGDAKRDCKQCEAKDLYTSSYFTVKRNYAEELGDEWLVLSATGPLLHDELVEPYDLQIDGGEFKGESEPNHDDVEAWANDVALVVDYLAQEYDEAVEIVVLAGADYVNPIRERLNSFVPYHSTIRYVRYPFDDTSGMFEQMSWCNEQIEAEGE